MALEWEEAVAVFRIVDVGSIFGLSGDSLSDTLGPFSPNLSGADSAGWAFR